MSTELKLPAQAVSAMKPSPSVAAGSLTLQTFLARLVGKENLTRDEAAELTNSLLNESATDAQIAGALVALSLKGATVDELTGMADAMRARAIRVQSSHERTIDTAGTGSSNAKTFNVSTAAAFVIAGAGLPVAKHGNRAATSQTGSADVLRALGVNVSASPVVSTKCLNDIGICFMFAPLYHSTTARVAAIRKQLSVFTPFNLLGPLTNPAAATHQVIGVARPSLAALMARTLAELGTTKTWVVHGNDGLDEISLATATQVIECFDGQERMFQISPEDFGLERTSLESLRVNTPEQSGAVIRSILCGDVRDAARNLVVLNAAAGLYVGQKAADLKQARQLAERSIDEGLALNKLEQLIKRTNEQD